MLFCHLVTLTLSQELLHKIANSRQFSQLIFMSVKSDTVEIVYCMLFNCAVTPTLSRRLPSQNDKFRAVFVQLVFTSSNSILTNRLAQSICHNKENGASPFTELDGHGGEH